MAHDFAALRTERRSMTGGETHKVVNQSPPYGGVNLFEADPLVNSAASGFPDSVAAGAFGARRLLGHARGARIRPPRQPPSRRSSSATMRSGERIDQVTFHPAYHALMRRSMLAGLHCSSFDRGEDEAGLRHRARAVRLYMTAQTECGHLCPMTMTNASLAQPASTRRSCSSDLGAAHPVAHLRPQFPPGRRRSAASPSAWA